MSRFVRSCLISRNLLMIRTGVRRYCDVQDRKQPVKFSTSEAAGWRAEFTRKGAYDDSPEIQPFIVSFSTGIFLWYFLYYREESDIDENLNLFSDIYGKVDDLEEVQLRIVRQDKLNKGEDIREVEIRLKQLETIRLSRISAKDTLPVTS